MERARSKHVSERQLVWYPKFSLEKINETQRCVSESGIWV